jgi:hypothetical protein
MFDTNPASARRRSSFNHLSFVPVAFAQMAFAPMTFHPLTFSQTTSTITSMVLKLLRFKVKKIFKNGIFFNCKNPSNFKTTNAIREQKLDLVRPEKEDNQ